MRDKRSENSNFRFNFLSKPFAKKLVRFIWFPYEFQIIVLLIFGYLVYVSIQAGGPAYFGEEIVPYIGHTNLATLVIWGLWWPALILSTLVFGRIWCTICPVELVMNIANRLARRLRIHGLVLSPWMQAGYAVLVVYVVLEFLVEGFGAEDVPIYTAAFLLGLVGLGLVVGFAFREPHAFCKGFCPLALFFNIYGRLTPVTLRKENDQICDQCVNKDCTLSAHRYALDRRSCPSYLSPHDLHPNDPCVLCLQCAKICAHDNIGYGVTRTRLRDRLSAVLPMSAALFLFISAGSVARELIDETPWLARIANFFPIGIATAANNAALRPWLEAIWYLGIFPGAMLAGIGWFGRRFQAQKPYSELVMRTASLLIPLTTAAYAMKSVIKISEHVVFLPLALSDPLGFLAADSIYMGVINPGPPMAGIWLAAIICAAILVVATFFTVKIIRQQSDAAVARLGKIGSSIFVSLFALTLIGFVVQ